MEQKNTHIHNENQLTEHSKDKKKWTTPDLIDEFDIKNTQSNAQTSPTSDGAQWAS